jgi:hypothetical protein
MARILHHLLKKYEIERLLERETLQLYKEHKICTGVRFGEVTKLDEPNALGSNWTAEISGGSKEGRAKFEYLLDQLQLSHLVRD